MDIRARLTLGIFVVTLVALAVALPTPPGPPSAPAASEPAVPTPRGYVCHRVAAPITIDGRLEASWSNAAWSDDFLDIEGDVRPRPRFRTRVKMLWDEHALYIAADLEEPHVGALLTEHDSYIFHHDHDFEVFLDPDGDGHLYGELEMNALNTTWDLLLTKPYKDGGQAIDAWEIAGLRTAVHIDGTINDPTDTDRGWTIEIAWPWKGLKQIARCPVPPRDGDRWRINFSRVELTHKFGAGRYRRVSGTTEENWVWSPQGVINMHMPERWGELLFSTAPPGSVAFHPDPATPARRTLHRIHDTQAAYRKQHGRWASKLSELSLANLGGDGLGRPRLEATSTHYEASVELCTPTGQVERWHIESDGRLWKD